MAALLAALLTTVAAGLPLSILLPVLLVVLALGLRELQGFSVAGGRYPCQITYSQQRWSFDYLPSQEQKKHSKALFSVPVECAEEHFICRWFVLLKYRRIEGGELPSCWAWLMPRAYCWRYLLVVADSMPAQSFHRFRLAVRFYSS
nr:protein YgfX [Sinobacterium caligoides]